MVNSPRPVHRRRYSDEFKKHFKSHEARLETQEDLKKIRRREEIEEDERRLRRRFRHIKLFKKSANGTLFEALDITTDENVILKEIKKTEKRYESFPGRVGCPEEIHFHYRAYEAAPDRIVKPIEWFERRSTFILVLERPVDFYDLHDVCEKYAPIDEISAFKVTQQITAACLALKKARICHRDIKPENTLMNLKTLEIKILDFGSAADWDEIQSGGVIPIGTLVYMPPEWFREKELKPEESTVFTIGAVLYILLTGEWDYKEGVLNRDSQSEEHLSEGSLRAIKRALTCISRNRITLFCFNKLHGTVIENLTKDGLSYLP